MAIQSDDYPVVSPPLIVQIVATDANLGIGMNGDLPWPHFPEDMLYFKDQTSGHPVIMGMSTFKSIGRALPNRVNIVLSRHCDEISPAVPGTIHYVSSVKEALSVASRECARLGTDRMFVIGGGTIYNQFAEYTDKILLTYIHESYQTDTRYPGAFYGEQVKTVDGNCLGAEGIRIGENHFHTVGKVLCHSTSISKDFTRWTLEKTK